MYIQYAVYSSSIHICQIIVGKKSLKSRAVHRKRHQYEILTKWCIPVVRVCVCVRPSVRPCVFVSARKTSLMLDLHHFVGKGKTRCFRALGAGLLDVPTPPSTADAFATTSASARASPEGESESS